MQILYWNVRGIANLDTRRVLKKLCCLHKPDFLIISEPWTSFDRIQPRFWNNLHLKPFAVNNRDSLAPNMWCFCREQFSPVLISSTNQQVAFSISWEGKVSFISAVYASTNYQTHRMLWNELADLQDINLGPWCFMGDFNAILGAHEVRGSNLPSKLSCDDFQAWTDTCSLIHLPTRGAEFTWNNGRRLGAHTEKRLDRAICNVDWLSSWSSTSCCTLTKSHSDHYPLLLVTKKEVKSFPSAFKFMSMWPDHQDCSRLVADIWCIPCYGYPMSILVQKLKAVKLALKSWIKSVFGDIRLNVQKALDEVDVVQQLIHIGGWSDALREQEATTQLNLQNALSFEEQFWKENARISWHKDGDCNTAFFHRVAKIKNTSKSMSVLRNGDDILTTEVDIEQQVLAYYTNLYASDNLCMDNDLISHTIPSLVTGEDNIMLSDLPSFDEIKSAVFSLNSSGAPGPDGFGGCFYQHFWDIIGTMSAIRLPSSFLRIGFCQTSIPTWLS